MSLKEYIKAFLLKVAVTIFRRFGGVPSEFQSLLTREVGGQPLTISSAQTQWPVLVNEGGVILSERSLELFYACIFPDFKKAPLLNEILQEIRSQPVLWENDEKLFSTLSAQFSRRLETSPSPSQRVEVQKGLLALEVHRERTAFNRGAYRASGTSSKDRIFWPDPTFKQEPRSLFETQPKVNVPCFIDRTTKIGSAGSCFAMEIAYRLQKEGFNYLVTEPHLTSSEHGFSQSCARWGTIFNTPSFRQLIERSFGLREVTPILWSTDDGGQRVLRDPYREDILYSSEEEYVRDYTHHKEASRKVLENVDVFILTLGMNEIWKLRSDGSVFSRSPWRIAASLIESHVMSVEDNVRELEAMLATWRKFNPKLKLIVSVSPVPLHATFQHATQHVITANSLSKAVLRVAAHEFSRRNEGVYYFSSFESVMYCTPQPWQEDQRHVSKDAVSRVMRLFEDLFVINSEKKPFAQVGLISDESVRNSQYV